MSNINLLPWRTEQILYKNNIFIAIGGVIAVATLILILILNMFIKILSSYRIQELNKLNDKIGFYQAKTKEIASLKERKKLLLERLSIINDLQSQRALIVNLLEQIANSVPNGIVLCKGCSQMSVNSASPRSMRQLSPKSVACALVS